MANFSQVNKIKTYRARVIEKSRVEFYDDNNRRCTWFHPSIGEPIGTVGNLSFSDNERRKIFIAFTVTPDQSLPDWPESRPRSPIGPFSAAHPPLVNEPTRNVDDAIREVLDEKQALVDPAVAESIVGDDTETQADGKPNLSEYEKARNSLIELTRQIIKRFSNDKVYINDEIAAVLALAIKRIEMKSHVNVWLRGPSGYGKTTIPQELAKLYDKRFVFVNCAVVSDPEEWFIIRGVRENQTVADYTPLSEALIDGNAIIVFDEVNRAQTWVLNALLSILDDTKSVSVGLANVKVGEGIAFFMTSNEGTQFVGTSDLDIALTNRIEASIIVEELSFEIEKKITMDHGVDERAADLIAKAVRRVRSVLTAAEVPVDISTRVLIKIAKQVSIGFSVEEAFQYAVTNSVSQDFRRTVFDAVKAALHAAVSHSS